MGIIAAIDMQATGQRIADLMDERHISVREMAEYFGFSTLNAVYKWRKGESLPSVDNLYALSVQMGVSMNDIIVGN